MGGTVMNYNEILTLFSEFNKKYPFISFYRLGEGISQNLIPIISFGEGKKEIVFIIRDNHTKNIFSYFLKECASLYSSSGNIYGVPFKYIYQKVRQRQ